jgi:hypothetical protein
MNSARHDVAIYDGFLDAFAAVVGPGRTALGRFVHRFRVAPHADDVAGAPIPGADDGLSLVPVSTDDKLAAVVFRPQRSVHVLLWVGDPEAAAAWARGHRAAVHAGTGSLQVFARPAPLGQE